MIRTIFICPSLCVSLFIIKNFGSHLDQFSEASIAIVMTPRIWCSLFTLCSQSYASLINITHCMHKTDGLVIMTHEAHTKEPSVSLREAPNNDNNYGSISVIETRVNIKSVPQEVYIKFASLNIHRIF